ncbi:MAG: CooT family nickel-binding protein [Candidatus Bathyarchaeia archaeon]|nr:CooT family nickel-binding protein [Candidatus Bathyarchaeota archaeon]
MCLLKVYVEDQNFGRRLIAKDVTLILREGDNIKLLDADMRETIVNNVKIITIDALNSVVTLRRMQNA